MQRSWVVSAQYRSAIETIKAARIEREISQRELGRRVGKSTSFINKVEQLERRLDILEFMALADALEIGLLEFVATVRAALPDRIDLS